jgi:hypothetical protein
MTLESDRKRIAELEDKMAQPETEIVRYADLIWAIDRLAAALDVIEAAERVVNWSSRQADDYAVFEDRLAKALREYEEAK